MPAPRIIHSTCDLALQFTTLQGQNAANVWQYRYSTPPTSDEMKALATAWWAQNGPTLRAMWSQGVVPQQIKVTDLDNAHLMTTATLPLGAGHQGTRGTKGEASGTAAQVTLRSPWRGRSNKGRKSFGGFDTLDMDDDLFSNQLLTWLAQLAVNALLSYVSGGNTFLPVIGSPKLHTSQQIVGAVLPDPFAGTQQTRLPEHGR